MTPEQLKASILQYAIQGKLVEQRPEEGTAEELYRQIQAEKKQLMKESKIKKEKPLAEITEAEIPFDIPESWKWVRLRDICTKIVDGDHNPPAGIREPSEYLMLSATNINNDTLVDLSKVRYLTKEVYDIEKQRTNVNVNDIFFTIVGSMGRSCVYKGGYNICFQRSVSVISTEIFPEYLKRVLDTPYIQNFMNINATGTVQKGFYLKQVENLVVPVPPLEEQHRIVAKIEEMLPLVEQYAASYEELEKLNAKFPEDMKKSILQYAIQGKLVEQRPEEGTAEELYRQIQAQKQQLMKEGKIKKEKPLAEITEAEIPFDIPESWKWVRLGHIIHFQGGYAFKSTSYVSSSNNQVIRLGNVKSNNLLLHEKEVFIDDELAQTATGYKLQENDILVTMTGTRRKKDYFFTLIVKKEHVDERNLYLNQRVGCFRALPGIDVEYLLTVLQNEALKNIIFLKETGTANQGNLGSEDMKKFVYVPLPPPAEQKRIVQKINQLLPYCHQLIK